MLPVEETSRLHFRQLIPSDAESLFELDSDPQVHLYLGNNPVSTLTQCSEAINMIREQYRTNGVGRMAVILKETDEFLGWAGLKLIKQFNGRENVYDLGYRFMQKHWGRGYATESARAFVDHGFNVLQLPMISAYADAGNENSRMVLQKAGLNYVETFDDDGVESVWYEKLNPAAQR